MRGRGEPLTDFSVGSSSPAAQFQYGSSLYPAGSVFGAFGGFFVWPAGLTGGLTTSGVLLNGCFTATTPAFWCASARSGWRATAAAKADAASSNLRR